MNRNYSSLGKEVLQFGKHVADACDAETAELIAESLNHRPALLDGVTLHHPHQLAFRPLANSIERSYIEPHDCDGLDWSPVASVSDPQRIPGHQRSRQGDEYACSCGVRWDVADGEEHP